MGLELMDESQKLLLFWVSDRYQASKKIEFPFSPNHVMSYLTRAPGNKQTDGLKQ